MGQSEEGKRNWGEKQSWNLRKETTSFSTLHKKTTAILNLIKAQESKLRIEMSNKKNIKFMGETKEMRQEVWRSHKAIATAQAKEWSQQVEWAADAP